MVAAGELKPRRGVEAKYSALDEQELEVLYRAASPEVKQDVVRELIQRGIVALEERINLLETQQSEIRKRKRGRTATEAESPEEQSIGRPPLLFLWIVGGVIICMLAILLV